MTDATQDQRAAQYRAEKSKGLHAGFDLLAGVLRGRSDLSFGQNRLANVFALIARHLDVKLPRHLDYSLSEVPLDDLLRRSGFIARELELGASWFSHDFGPLLLVDSADEHYAALPEAGRYKVTNGEELVEPASIQIAKAFAIYPPLPMQRLSTTDLIQFYWRQVRSDLVLFGLLSVLIALVTSVAPAITSYIIDGVVPDQDRWLLYQLALLLVIMASAQATIEYFIDWVQLRMQTRSGLAVRAALIQRLLDMAASSVQPPTTLALQLQFAQSLLTGISTAALRLCSGGLLLVAATALMCWFRPIAGLATLSAALLILLVMVIIGRLRLQVMAESQQLDINSSARLFDMLSNLSLMRVTGIDQLFFASWMRSYAAVRDKLMRAKWLAAVAPALQNSWPLLLMLTGYGMAAVIGISVSEQGDFIAFTTAMGTLLLALNQLTAALEELFQSLPMRAAVQPLLAFDATPAKGGATPRLMGNIQLLHLSLHYHNAKGPALNDLSLAVSAGEYVGITGASGSGKSSIIRCMMGLEQPSEGLVLFDGHALNTFDTQALRRQLGVVMQEQSLIPGSLYDNIAGLSPLTLEQAWAAAEAADIAEYIHALPMGMFTMVNDSDPVFSGGQVQKILLARAIALRSPILILDEATSALDERSQTQICGKLAEMDCTRIVIAHRLGTLRYCDRIVVMDKGHIVQQGDWQSLAEQPGIFQDMLRLTGGNSDVG